MFVLKAKAGSANTHYGATRGTDISGRYYRHCYSNTEGWWTADLQKAKIYNTAAGAKCNWDSDKCEVVEVKVTLA